MWTKVDELCIFSKHYNQRRTYFMPNKIDQHFGKMRYPNINVHMARNLRYICGTKHLFFIHKIVTTYSPQENKDQC